jgi:hypothetical protein
MPLGSGAFAGIFKGGSSPWATHDSGILLYLSGSRLSSDWSLADGPKSITYAAVASGTNIATFTCFERIYHDLFAPGHKLKHVSWGHHVPRKSP